MIESRRERKHPAVNPDVNDGELTGLVSAPAMAEDTVAIADAQWRAHVERVLPLASRLAEAFPQAADHQLRQELGAGFMQRAD